jgi:hypothetical protein
VLTSLNLSSNNLQVRGTKIVAEAMKVTMLLPSFWYHFYVHLAAVVVLLLFTDYLQDDGATSTLTFGDKQAVTMTIEMTEANFSRKLYSFEAQIVAAFLPKCT